MMLKLLVLVGAISLGALGAQLYQTWQPITRPTPAATALDKPAAIDAPPAVSWPIGPDPSLLTETRERPLFVRERRPISATPIELPEPTQEVAAPPPAPDLPSLRLTGIVITPNGKAALLMEPGKQAATRAYVGDRVAAWQVTAVRADKVVLSGNDTSQELQLFDFPAPPQPAGNAGENPPQTQSERPRAQTQTFLERRKQLLERRRAIRQRAARERQ